MNPQSLPLNLAKDVKLVKTNAIRMTTPDPEKRIFDEKVAESLAYSIETEGLLNPPIVEALPNGEYKVLAGRHRVHACAKILGWQEISCLVLTEPDEELVESIDLATNLLTHPLNESQRRWAIQRLLELYEKRYPASTKQGRRPHGEGFAKTLEKIFGVSQGHAQRLATTAKVITPEDRATLEGAGVPQNKIDKIAELRDLGAINAAVNMTAAGRDPDEAIRQGKAIKEKAAASKKAPKSKTAKQGEAADAARAPEKEMTDEKWLDLHCSKIMSILSFKTAFRRDAILYRRAFETLVRFRTNMKKPLAEAKKPGENGTFFANLYKIVRASHPMHWFMCDGCNGTGHVPDHPDQQCGKCLGGAYKLKFEET